MMEFALHRSIFLRFTYRDINSKGSNIRIPAVPRYKDKIFHIIISQKGNLIRTTPAITRTITEQIGTTAFEDDSAKIERPSCHTDSCNFFTSPKLVPDSSDSRRDIASLTIKVGKGSRAVPSC